MVVELGFAGVDWLVREMLKEAGDAVVLEPADAREAVRAAAEAIAAGSALVSALTGASEPPRSDQHDRREQARVPRPSSGSSSAPPTASTAGRT